MVQKYIIDNNYIICQGCYENYIEKTSHVCFECELSFAIHDAAAFALRVEHLRACPGTVIKERPMLPNPRHKANQ
jgi:hypothetical protein